MINKVATSVALALGDVSDGACVLIGGFGTAGIAHELIDGLIPHGARDLSIVNNNAGNGDSGLAALLNAFRVRKLICSFRSAPSPASARHPKGVPENLGAARHFLRSHHDQTRLYL